MTGLLLARAGIETVVLEKHADFLRDFRGDTVHPSTLDVMHELGVLDEFLQRPHQRVEDLHGRIGSAYITFADFRTLRTHCRFLALMPQWEFLDFLAGVALRYPAFHLLMEADVHGLMESANRITGVRATTPNGAIEVRADLVIGCDGRHSAVRAAAGLPVETLGAPMDVLWLRMSRDENDPTDTFGQIDAGTMLVMLNRDTYWQCACVIPKGGYDAIRGDGIEILRVRLRTTAPWLRDRVDEIETWDDVKLLTVTVDRLQRWYRSGLLCIGDAAHAMSPIGGVGINLAIQDAVAAGNLLAAPLRRGAVTDADLHAVQERREPPTRKTQAMQVFLQKNVITAVLGSPEQLKPPLFLKMIARFPWLARFPARILGMGFRPEHVDLAVIDGGR